MRGWHGTGEVVQKAHKFQTGRRLSSEGLSLTLVSVFNSKVFHALNLRSHIPSPKANDKDLSETTYKSTTFLVIPQCIHTSRQCVLYFEPI